MASDLSEDEAATRKTLRHGLGFILIFNSLLLAFLLFKPVPHAVLALADNLTCWLGPLALLIWSFFGPRRTALQESSRPNGTPFRSLNWPALLLGLGILGFNLGDGIWAFYEHILHRETPFPSWADASYLSGYPFLLFGILLLPKRPMSASYRARIFLDSLMMMTAMVTFSWYYVLGPTILKGAETTLGKFLGAAYPLADLVLFFCLLMLSARASERAQRTVTALLSAGLISVIVADTLFAYQTLQNTYATGSLIDVGWPLGYMLLCLAARLVRQTACAQTGKQSDSLLAESAALPPFTVWRSLLPYAFLPAMGALLFFTWKLHGDEDREAGVFLGAAALIGIVLLRQVFALLENGRLYKRLQQTYSDLETRNRETSAYARQTEQLNEELIAMQAELLANNQALSEANARLEALATTDSMTGLPNHRAFQERLRAGWAQARRHAQPLSLLFVDVDYFKQYNDAFGHPAGDEVLRQVAQLLRANVREGDFVARYGGEEFAALLPQTEANAALAVAERIRAAVAIHAFPRRAVTLSLGMACQTGDSVNIETLVTNADQALYAAKRLGRNRVALASDLTAELAEELLPASALWRNVGDGAKSGHEIGWGNIEGLLQEAAGQVLASLLDALDLREAEAEGHSQRVVRFALRLAREAHSLGLVSLTPADIRELAFGALLHDIGKIGVPDRILLKSGPLTAEELIEMRCHLGHGIALIQRFPLLAHALPVIQYHHERWDGAGYPYGLAGEAIPLTARLFALVDAFEAMSCDRPYRAKFPYAAIRAEIERQADAQFDPNLATAFLNIPESEWKRLSRPDTAEALLFAADIESLPHAA